MSFSSGFFFYFLQGSIKSSHLRNIFYILAKLRVIEDFFPPLNFYSLFLSLFQDILFKISAGISLFSILHLLQYNTIFLFFSVYKCKKSSNSQVTENLHTLGQSLFSMLFDLSLP